VLDKKIRKMNRTDQGIKVFEKLKSSYLYTSKKLDSSWNESARKKKEEKRKKQQDNRSRKLILSI